MAKHPTRRRLLLLLITAVAILAGAFYLRPVESYFAIDRLLLWWAGFESREVQLGPNRIHYYVGGEGDPIVLVHGLGSRASQWRALLTGLVKHRRVYALDLLGFGYSDKPQDAEYSIGQQAELVRQFVDSQQLSKTDLVGWSMGGWIAANFASKWPERVTRLVLAASAGMRFEPDFDPHVLHPKNLEDLNEMLRLIAAPVPPGFVQQDLLREMKEQSWVVERALNSMLSGRDAMDGRLGRVQMPVLLIWGKKDLLTPLIVAESMRFEMSQAQLKTYANCGHLVPVECADEVLPDLESFLAK